MKNKTTSTRPIKQAGYSHDKLDARRNRRQNEADIRQGNHDSLSVAEKIAKARSRRGESKRELARLKSA